MFIFYYAVLSEVSPPTALSPFAAAAITGGNPFRTMMLTWKYTLPAFLVPFVFTLSPEGLGVLLQAPLRDVVSASGTAAVGVAALAGGLGGWIRGPVSLPGRAALTGAGVLLCYAGLWADLAGMRSYCRGADLALSKAAHSRRDSKRQLIDGLTATCRIRGARTKVVAGGTRTIFGLSKSGARAGNCPYSQPTKTGLEHRV